MTDIWIPVSVGELCDKITILEIKQQFIQDQDKRRFVTQELGLLREQAKDLDQHCLINLIQDLKNINLRLWHIEDLKRRKIKSHDLDQEFLDLATAVCELNDQRSLIKREINSKSGSSMQEIKSHT